MIAIGMGLAFGAYTIGLWGYCLVMGYNVPFTALFKTTWPGTAAVTPNLINPGSIAATAKNAQPSS